MAPWVKSLAMQTRPTELGSWIPRKKEIITFQKLSSDFHLHIVYFHLSWPYLHSHIVCTYNNNKYTFAWHGHACTPISYTHAHTIIIHANLRVDIVPTFQAVRNTRANDDREMQYDNEVRTAHRKGPSLEVPSLKWL